jgi:Mg-chelatase subunit ChlD
VKNKKGLFWGCLFLTLFFNIQGRVALSQEKVSAQLDQPLTAGWADWTKPYNNPSELAKDVIQKSYVFWNWLGRSTAKSTYQVGAFFAMYGVGYILLESPNLTADLISGGFVKVGVQFGRDFFVHIVEWGVETPSVLCERISKSTIQEGLEDYDIAYEIARKYVDTGKISDEDAKNFLNHRWGIYKLAAARELWNQSRDFNKDQIDRQMGKIVSKEILNELEKEHFEEFGIGTEDRLISATDAAFIVKDICDIFEKKKIGLMVYQPYLDFLEAMNYINQLRMDEQARFDSPQSIPTSDMDSDLVIGLIIDSSGSMQENDPRDIRKIAAELIVNQLPEKTKVFIVDFDDNATWLNPQAWQSWTPDELKQAIGQINSSGGTIVGGGIEKMKEAFSGRVNSSENKGVLLLTDGLGEYNDEAEWFKEQNIPIYTISLVGEENAELLRNIALATNGQYMKAMSEGDIVRAFNQFFIQLMGNSGICSEHGTIRQDQNIIHEFISDRGMPNFNVTCVWPGSRIGMTLVSPSGTTYSDGFGDGQWNSSTGYVSVKINNPEAGKWQSLLTGLEIPSGGESYGFEVNGESPIKMDMTPRVSGTRGIGFDFQTGGLVKDINPNIFVITPKNDTLNISRAFYGAGFDYNPTQGKGSYRFNVNLSAKDQSGVPIQRFFSRSVFLGEFVPTNRAQVKRVMGNFVMTDLGKSVGNRSGIRCSVFEGGTALQTKIAIGYVTHVTEGGCTVQIQKYLIPKKISDQDFVELDLEAWSRDTR